MKIDGWRHTEFPSGPLTNHTYEHREHGTIHGNDTFGYHSVHKVTDPRSWDKYHETLEEAKAFLKNKTKRINKLRKP